MIVSFSVENFRSFLGEETLSLVASKRLAGKFEDHALPIPDSDEQVLKTAVIYGANGAGKSNLFRALQYFKGLALNPRKKNAGTGREAFRLAGAPQDPSSFDLQFVAKGRLYRFGIKVDDQKVLEEWLVRVEGGREKPLYERVTEANDAVTVDAGGLTDGANAKLRALFTVGGPPNQSFLATIKATLGEADIGEELKGIFDWFEARLKLIDPNVSVPELGHLLSKDEKLRDFSERFLRHSSTGVDRLSVKKSEIAENDLFGIIPESLVRDALDGFDNERDGAILFGIGTPETNLLIERTAENKYFSLTIQAEHDCASGNSVPLELKDESDGTRRLLELIPALHYADDDGAVYVIDEIDRSLHPLLVYEFVKYFLQLAQGVRHQLIVTTHESNLLDLELLRRDEIWFAEKDRASATHLYSLSDFKVRTDLEIRKHYLHGRFGAVPFFGSLDRLTDEAEVVR